MNAIGRQRVACLCLLDLYAAFDRQTIQFPWFAYFCGLEFIYHCA